MKLNFAPIDNVTQGIIGRISKVHVYRSIKIAATSFRAHKKMTIYTFYIVMHQITRWNNSILDPLGLSYGAWGIILCFGAACKHTNSIITKNIVDKSLGEGKGVEEAKWGALILEVKK